MANTIVLRKRANVRSGGKSLAEAGTQKEFLAASIRTLYAEYLHTRRISDEAFGFTERADASESGERLANLIHGVHLEIKKALLGAVLVINGYPEDLPDDWSPCDVVVDGVRFIAHPGPDGVECDPTPYLTIIERPQVTEDNIDSILGAQ